MPFTTREIVKKHILDHHIGSTAIENEPLQLTGTDYSYLSHKVLVLNSEKVKGRQNLEPSREDIDFSVSDTIDLSYGELIPDTVVIASDSSLGTIYAENIDYSVDYDFGRVIRIQSGSIPAGAPVTVWYMFFTVYEKGIDYEIDYQRGRMRRKSGSAIESGQRLLIDFSAQFGGLDDDSMDNAIAEADDQILAFIDESYRESSDRSLVTAETYMAVSIICRIKAMESIAANVSADSGSWSSISDQYKKEAYLLLSRYAGKIGSLNKPSKA